MNTPEKWFVKITNENRNLINIGRKINNLLPFAYSEKSFGCVLNNFAYKFEPDESYQELSDDELLDVIYNVALTLVSKEDILTYLKYEKKLNG